MKKGLFKSATPEQIRNRPGNSVATRYDGYGQSIILEVMKELMEQRNIVVNDCLNFVIREVNEKMMEMWYEKGSV